MKYPIPIDTIHIEKSILYSKGLPVKISIKMVNYLFLEIVFFFFANSGDTDFIWVFTICKSTCLPVSRMKRDHKFHTQLI